MKKEKIFIVLLLIVVIFEGTLLISNQTHTAVNAAVAWKTADNIMIFSESGSYVDDSGKYRWINDTMMEIKFDNGITWTVDQTKVHIKNGELKK